MLITSHMVSVVMVTELVLGQLWIQLLVGRGHESMHIM